MALIQALREELDKTRSKIKEKEIIIENLRAQNYNNYRKSGEKEEEEGEEGEDSTSEDEEMEE